MKHLSQVIALSFFGWIAIEVMLLIAPVVILLQLFVTRITREKKVCEIRRGRKAMENNMWAIE